MLRILISGLLPYESGKTWVGLTLTKKLSEIGIKVGIFKPIAGHNAWYQYSTVIESFARGVLVGEDVVKYLNVVKDIDVEVSNPIDILLAPLDPRRYLSEKVWDYLTDLENQFKQMVLARVSRCSPKFTKHFVFNENMVKISPPLKNVLEELSRKLKAIEINVEDFVKNLRVPDIENELFKCLELVEQGKNVVLIESFNNAITPYIGILEHVDIMMIATPTAILIYENINEVLTTLKGVVKKFGEKGFDSAYIVAKVKPSEIVYIKPRLNVEEKDEVIETIALKVISRDKPLNKFV